MQIDWLVGWLRHESWQALPRHVPCWPGSLSATGRPVLTPVPCLLQLSRTTMCPALSNVCVASHMRSPICLAYAMIAANTCATGVYAALASAYLFHLSILSIACLFVILCITHQICLEGFKDATPCRALRVAFIFGVTGSK